MNGAPNAAAPALPGPRRAAALTALFAAVVSACVSPETAVQQCAVTGRGSPADSSEAAQTCQHAVARFAELVAQPAPPVQVHLADTMAMSIDYERDAGRLVLPTMAGRARVEEVLGSGALGEWLVAHEFGHLLLMTAVRTVHGEEDTTRHHGAYGSALPDWLDEAVAIWMEPDTLRARRVAQARAAAATAPHLTAFVQLRHPRTARSRGVIAWRVTTEVIRRTVGPCRGICPGRSPLDEQPPGRRVETALHRDGRLTTDTTYFDPDAVTAAADTASDSYYPFAAAALTFIHETGGTAATAELWRRLLADPLDDRALLALPGLPADAAALDSAWHAWLREGRH